MKQIYFTVTNDLSYDQRMHRICTSLAGAGFAVTLVGRMLPHSLPLQTKSFRQKRLSCLFKKGFLFYAEYNVRLFFFLMPKKMDAVCAIDLDTILPCLLVSGIKKTKRIYDAHEFFTELKEVHTRPLVKRIWKAIERFCVPRFHYGYTVSEGIAKEFERLYHRNYEVIRNLPVSRPLKEVPKEDFILYQGAVNEGRGFEYLVPAMKFVSSRLVVCGDGNFMPQFKDLIRFHGMENKVEIKGMMVPEALNELSSKARLGLCLAEKEGLNQFLALPNKFFDYIQAGLPQIAMDFPEYRKVNDQYQVAVLMDHLDPIHLAHTITETLSDQKLLARLHESCLAARKEFCWEKEEKKLVNYYRQIFSIG